MRIHALVGGLLLAAIHNGADGAQAADAIPADTLTHVATRDAYLDETARRLMLGVRAARDPTRLAIDSYTALVQERVGIELPTIQRDRPWVNAERVARIRWSREESNVVHVLGARLRNPGVGADVLPRFFPGLETGRLAIDPLWDPFASPSFESGALAIAVPVRSPLEAGSERYYQFRSGDTVAVQLEGDGAIEVVEVTVIPRYRSIRLVAAMLWIDPETLELVRVAYRPAKRVDREMSGRLRQGGEWRPRVWIDVGDSTSADGSADSPGLLSRLVNLGFHRVVGRLEIDASAVVVEYGLSEGRHWLPRSVQVEGYLAWENVTATGYVPPAVPVTFDWRAEVESIQERGVDAAPGAAATVAEALARWRQPGDSIGGEVEAEAESPDTTVTITPADRQALTASRLLPRSIWHDSGVEAMRMPPQALVDDLSAIGTGDGTDASEAANPWFFFPPFMTLGLMRYTPVEGVSTGTYLRRDFGWWRSALTVRIGTRRWATPEVDLTLQRDRPSRRVQFSVYRSLRSGALGVGGINGWPGYFVSSGDSVTFHWSRGATVRLLSGNGKRNRFSLSLFAERDAEVESDTERTRVGTALEWRPWWGGLDDGSIGGGGYVGARGSAGDNPHVRAMATGAIAIPLPGNLSIGLEAGVAGVWGEPAPQDLWSLGSSASWLRGHRGSVESSWIRMARADLQRHIGLVSLSVFGDWASAGGADYYAVGAGVVLLDGMLRLDFAKSLGSEGSGGLEAGWRLQPRGFAFF